jgi:hypothetical protein
MSHSHALHGAHEAANESRRTTPEDLVSCWKGSDIGHLGRWLRERGGVPESDLGAGLRADRDLHRWIKTQLKAGPDGTSEKTQVYLRWVLWWLYVKHGPEDVPEVVARHLASPGGKTRVGGGWRPETDNIWQDRPEDPQRLGRLPPAVEATRTTAPTGTLHPGKRGIAIKTPWSKPFVDDLKTLPLWGRKWKEKKGVWIIDDCFAAFVGDLCRYYFG